MKSWLNYKLILFSCVTGLSLTGICLQREAPAAAGIGAPPNVVLLMLDGVRWQEVMRGTDSAIDGGAPTRAIFTRLWGSALPGGVLFGDQDRGNRMEASNLSLLSMPAYHSIMAGALQGCLTNSCARIGVETVQERVRRELGLEKGEVATIASWDKMELAVERVEGATFVNAGIVPLQDGTSDPELERLNRLQAQDLPEWRDGCRADKYTFAQALRYLRVHRPRFLSISLNDSDEWAHAGNYPRYVETLEAYDGWIAELRSALAAMGDYGRATTLLVTTDHGRGNGRGWRDHGVFQPGSKNVWLYAESPATRWTRPEARSGYTHVDIRPTIEATLGLEPVRCPGCGRVMSEVVSGR